VATTDAFDALSDAVLAVASETELEPVLQRLVHSARDLVDARYAALGIPDGHGGFAKFLTSGVTDEEIAAIGPLPRTHGLLGAMLASTDSFRTDDIRDDPRFEWWPREHPVMRSFLGVPIVARGEVLGAFYLTEKTGSARFSDDDQRLIEVFAAHAATAIANARLYERSRELSVVEERNRLARDLHDSVAQTLFSLSLRAEAAVELARRDPDRAAAEIDEVRGITRAALEELRSIVFELRPADLAADGLGATLAKHVDVLSRVNGQRIDLTVVGEERLGPDVELELFRIAQEAISNAMKHAGASEVSVRVAPATARPLVVRDDGVGFDPSSPRLRGRHLGLTSMEERAKAIGGDLTIESAPGRGTTVTVRT
jgi:signal transduction histidine kinase